MVRTKSSGEACTRRMVMKVCAFERLSSVELKVEYYDTMIDYIESIIKIVQNRTYQIKNAIEWQKFIRGYD